MKVNWDEIRKINNKILNKSTSERKSNLHVRNKITWVLLLKILRIKRALPVIKKRDIAKIKATYPTHKNFKKSNTVFSFPFDFFFHNAAFVPYRLDLD